jgi:NADH-quinone oxidoreductase E subunit
MQPFAAPSEDLRGRDACRVDGLGREVRFSAEGLAELERLFTRYPTRQAVVLPALWIAQRELGWIPSEAITYVAGLCDVPPAHVYGVVSFYTMFNRTPKGRWHLQLCTNLSCQLLGAEHVLECLREKLGIELGGTTADRLFSLDEVECLAACELAPVLQVNDEFHGPVTPESVGPLLEELRRREARAPWK